VFAHPQALRDTLDADDADLENASDEKAAQTQKLAIN
jgi:hypothetical protein